MTFPTLDRPIATIPDARAIRSLAPSLAAAAQAVYDDWRQDAEGLDDVYGGGGICDAVAGALLPVLSGAGVENFATIQASCGENHTFIVALLDEGVWSIDIPPGVYETGAAYTWTKIEGVRFAPDDIAFDRIGDPMEPEQFEAAYAE